ncbi:MAG: acyl carrier protein [Alphaproteobacteria bacterium]|nr:acyl carrier protein [Alphaproteobacteria bacterium]
MSDDVLERVQQVCRDVFEDDDIVLTRSSTAKDIEGFDSLMKITFFVALEEEFGLRFGSAEIADLPDMGAVADLVRAKL